MLLQSYVGGVFGVFKSLLPSPAGVPAEPPFSQGSAASPHQPTPLCRCYPLSPACSRCPRRMLSPELTVRSCLCRNTNAGTGLPFRCGQMPALRASRCVSGTSFNLIHSREQLCPAGPGGSLESSSSFPLEFQEADLTARGAQAEFFTASGVASRGRCERQAGSGLTARVCI